MGLVGSALSSVIWRIFGSFCWFLGFRALGYSRGFQLQDEEEGIGFEPRVLTFQIKGSVRPRVQDPRFEV